MTTTSAGSPRPSSLIRNALLLFATTKINQCLLRNIEITRFNLYRTLIQCYTQHVFATVLWYTTTETQRSSPPRKRGTDGIRPVPVLCSESVGSSHSYTIYRMSQEECAILRESVPYFKLYRYNPKHLYPKLNGYGDNSQRKVWTSCIPVFCTPTAVSRDTPPSSHLIACGAYVG